MKITRREVGEGTGGLFLKMKDGESRIGVLRGEIYEFYQVWENGKPRVVSPGDPEGKSRFRLNFVTKEDGDLKVKIFEFGVTINNQLYDLIKEYDDLESNAVKITRHGSGTDTTYNVIRAKDQPTAEQWKKIEAMPLNILEHKNSPPKSDEPEPGF